MLFTMSIGKLQSLLHLLTEIMQQFAVHFDTFIFSCGILIPLVMVVVVFYVCVCVCVCACACVCVCAFMHAHKHVCAHGIAISQTVKKM